MYMFGDDFYLDLANRLMILAIAATNKHTRTRRNDKLWHAAYLGISAYSVGIPAYYEINGLFGISGYNVSGLFALLTIAVVSRLLS